MCGIAGCWDQRAATAGHVLEDLAGRMADALVHRGPDDRGVWADPAAGLGLGFRRLAIVDLTAEGHQPMPSADGRWVIVFNGEVYNHRALRAELEALGHRFRGHSDTEVMLEAMSAWGVEAAVRRFNGIFAFAAWDRRERRLHLVRDRHGVKPLYYGWAGSTLLFGSELKALRAHPAFTRRVDRGALALLLHYGYVESPYAIVEGVRKLAPGSVLTVSADSTAATASPRAY